MKIAIGAVQFGLDYGVSNTYGKTSEYEALKILDYANSKGIKFIDTASSYGNSEETIGCVYGQNNFEIITKTPSFSDKIITSSQVTKLNNSFEKSLCLLNKSYLYGLLIHSSDDLLKPGGEKLYDEMQRLKFLGLVQKIGVSVYSSFQIEAILDKFDIDLIQLPINIVDQKILYDGSLLRLKEKGVEIHARSVFLQGLLLMSIAKLPQYFRAIEPSIKKFHSSAKLLSLSKLELALAFVNNIKEIDKVVVGFNSLSQLEQIIHASKIVLNPLEFGDLSINDVSYTNPSNWSM